MMHYVEKLAAFFSATLAIAAVSSYSAAILNICLLSAPYWKTQALLPENRQHWLPS